ncbi:protein FAM110A [Gouania willdenowi]|uniref:Protein FAM110A-like n=1 Tax=Gouania willdenowi TaxID=441366 RepID=A0A8C5EMU7_GOUWI|nr:protein FAM110A-like [Gouania willdenowi]XP_028309011.1 protein FAM110A-like [Gouania willdenowi]XP_028309012.1 protein FAM110A-like [Gouania willdenowi]
MPVETLRPSDGRQAGVPFTSAMPFRILNKGPDYFRRQAEPGTRKLSAVERLEADKSKYVKSQQVALTRQAPIKPPIIRKPLLPPGLLHQYQISTPPRKTSQCPPEKESRGRRPVFDLDILNNLINDVCDGPLPHSEFSSSTSPSSSSPSSGAKSISSSLGAESEKINRLLNNLKPQNLTTTNSCSPSSCLSSPFSSNLRTPSTAEPFHRMAPVPVRAPCFGAPAPYSNPNTVTVRRVDVRPQADLRNPQKVNVQRQQRPRQTAQGQAPPPPLAPKPKNLPPPPAYLQTSSMMAQAIPPASPAFTRLSNASSKGSARKHPSLHRSKSDLSDRYSRATADLERFFNYCGLDPEEVDGLGGVERFTRANSDIVSLSKMRSVSTVSSGCGDEAGQMREDSAEDDRDGPSRVTERIPYGISVIERNARVIKWLYGIRQARDAGGAISNV